MAARILVADDDATLQRLVFHTLKLEGHEVLTAKDGQEALDILAREQMDLVVLDVMMPLMNGFEVCRALRQRPETATLPIIMLSGLSDVQEKVMGLRSGADEYLTKPIDLRELAVRVEMLLGRHRVLRQTAAPKSAKVLTFYGAKGGVGTTTVALNVAALLAKSGKTVLVAELRPDYGTCAAQLKTTPEKDLSSLLAVEPHAITEALVSGVLYNTSFGVRVLFGPQRVDNFSELEPVRVGAILGRLARLADFVILDLSSAALPAYEVVVKNSNHVLLLVEPEISSVAAANVKLKLLDAWGASASLVSLVVVNRLGTMFLSLREIENRLGRKISGIAPPAIDVIGVAMQYGTPLVVYQPDHMLSINLADLVAYLTERPVDLPR